MKVYDGDTIKIVFPVNKEFFKFTCRLSGIDTPEMKSHDKNEKKYAQFVQKKLSGRILNQLVTVKCGKFDKYGRLLGTLYIKKNDLISVNQMMIDNKHGYPYHGGTKKQF